MDGGSWSTDRLVTAMNSSEGGQFSVWMGYLEKASVFLLFFPDLCNMSNTSNSVTHLCYCPVFSFQKVVKGTVICVDDAICVPVGSH